MNEQDSQIMSGNDRSTRITADDTADMLMDFTDILFYNFRTHEAAQKAFERIADYLDIFRAAVCVSSGRNAGTLQTLYTTETAVDDTTRIEEKSLRSIDGTTYTYRIYRRGGAAPLDMMQRRAMEFIFKLLHTYLNRQSSLEMAQYAKEHDMLFGCLNSNGMSEKLAAYRRDGVDFSKYAVVFMNVCKFKAINARIGFENGNRVMQFIINSLRSLLTEQELFAHIGGDNFSMLIRQDGLEERLHSLNSLICDILHEGRNVPIEIAFRMGVYCIEAGQDEISEIMENANLACRLARQCGKQNILYYNDERRRQYEHTKMLEAALEPALHNGEFLIYFQPKVCLDDFRIIGAEALSRWMHEGRMMKPDSYITIFEQDGLITDIDFYVFEQVCKMLRVWMDAAIPVVPISVNFSKITLETAHFPEKLLKIAAQYQVPVEYLEIEFTENCCMEDEEKFNEILTDLKKAGFSASLDDFGKGYSSINMLRNMNFDVLKLDKSFHNEGGKDTEGAKIILRSIVGMAKDLGIQVISEGVETAEQVQFLRQLKCEKAQGYYFDKPLPADQFIERLHEGVYHRD